MSLSVQNPKKLKIIRDPIHGYIEIEETICKDFIDTFQFQRLRNIRQGCMSAVYPSATQNRFEHSLGVYHLGKNIFQNIIDKQKDEELKQKCLKYKNTLELACLLHDIGHAPFSHLCEKYYPKQDNLKKILKNEWGIDLSTDKDHDPAKHELMSCIVALKTFGEILKDKYYVDLEYFCRLITGSAYPLGNGETNNLKNNLINILSGSFDSDKLDYIMRDAQSAGISALSLDVPRTISAFNIIMNNSRLSYVIEKSGFSVITSVISNRNYLYYWVYSNHKILYYQEIFSRYLEAIKSDYEDEFEKLFSLDAIVGTKKVNIPFIKMVTLIDDTDILTMLKYIHNKNNNYSFYYKHLFSREHFKQLWKTKIEYDYYKSLPDLAGMEDIEELALEDPQEIEKRLVEASENTLNKHDFIVIGNDPKISYPIESKEAKICLSNLDNESNQLVSFRKVFGNIDLLPNTDKSGIVYIAINPKKNDVKEKLFKAMKRL